MNTRVIFLLLTAVILSGCTSILSSTPTPQMAYVGDLSNNRVSRAGETIAYAKSDNGSDTFVYIFKGVDGKGGIHISRVMRSSIVGGGQRSSRFSSLLGSKSPRSVELVYMPDQTLLVSPGVHVVFIKSTPSELHYRVIMTSS